MDRTTAHLVEYAAAAAYERLPAQAVLDCKRRIIDSLACAAGAWHEPPCAMARAVAARHTGTPSATVLGSSAPVSMEAAAFANGLMLRYLDFSDAYPMKSRGHPSDVITALIAVAEAQRSSGAALINAITLAYDVFCSFCETLDINGRGFDQATYCGLAAAVGAGKLLGLDATQLGHAISLSLAPSLAMYITRRGGELSVWKGAAAANACRNALFGALLAREGFSGPDAIFEGKGGLWDMVAGAGERPEWRIHVGPDAPHRVSATHLKPFPLAYHGLPAVSAVIDLRDKLPLEDIAHVQVDTYAQAIRIMADHPSRWSPTTRETADHSLPYAIAAAFVDGTIGEASFSAQKIADPRIRALMPLIEVREDAALSALHPQAAPARITVTSHSGARFSTEVRYPKGHTGNPMTDAEIDAKFRQLFAAYGPAEQGERVLQALRGLERAPLAGEVWALLQHRH